MLTIPNILGFAENIMMTNYGILGLPKARGKKKGGNKSRLFLGNLPITV